MSDRALIEAAQGGDEDAAASLYHRHVDRVHRICYRIVLDRSQVADCVQEVWFKVFRSLDRQHGHHSFAAWLNTVAANTAIDCYRRWKRQGNHVGIDDLSEECLPSAAAPDGKRLDDAVLQQRVQRALSAITVNQRTAFALRYYEDMSPSEIARILGCREGTVRTHLRRGLLKLRDKLTVKQRIRGS